MDFEIYIKIDGCMVRIDSILEHLLSSDDFDQICCFVSGFKEGRCYLHEKTHEEK